MHSSDSKTPQGMKNDAFDDTRDPQRATRSKSMDTFKPSSTNEASASTLPTNGAKAQEQTASPVANAHFYDDNGHETVADVFPNGTLAIENGTSIGSIDGTGSYSLNRPDISVQQNGTVFDKQSVVVTDSGNPLGQSLARSEREHAMQNAFSALLPESAKVDGQGNRLDGTGVKVVIYDDDLRGEHPAAIEQIIRGIAPGATTEIVNASSLFTREYPDINPNDTLDRSLATRIATDIEDGTNHLRDIVTQHNPDIINMSSEPSTLEWGRRVFIEDRFNPALAEKFAAHPVLSKLGDASTTGTSQLKTAVEYVDTLIQTSPEIQAAIDQRNDFISSLDKEPIMVIAAGNDGQVAKSLGLSNGEGMAKLTKDAIVVGASHPNNTPELDDDTMALLSSTGTPTHHPTLAAPGHEVIVGSELTRLAPNNNGVISGTSYAAPEVVGTIALMLQKNSTLNSDDVRRILTDTAVDTSAPLESEGAGMMDPVAALNAVQNP